MSYDMKKIRKTFIDAMKENGSGFHAPRGNNKTGKIPAWNIAPGITCSGQACKACLVDGCYALKNMCCHGYDLEKNNVMRAWIENTVLVMKDLARFERLMIAYLEKTRPAYFRIHASGDFFSVEYAAAWYRIAKRFPGIKFLAFTKQWAVVRGVPFYELENFSLVLSGWTGVTIPDDLRARYHCAWCDDGKETRIPADAIECPGNCETCGMCWNLRKLDRDTYFHKH